MSKRVTKYDLAKDIEALNFQLGRSPWSFYGLMTVYCASFTKAELLEIRDRLLSYVR